MGFLPTVSEILALTTSAVREETAAASVARAQAELEWQAAIAALEAFLRSMQATEARCGSEPQDVFPHPRRGVMLAGPTPVFSDPELSLDLPTWTFTNAPLQSLTYPLLPGRTSAATETLPTQMASIPLLPSDPLVQEQFCLVLTPTFGLVMVLGQFGTDRFRFDFSFDPEVLLRTWGILRPRALLTRSPHLQPLDLLLQQLPLRAPDYRIPEQFGRLLLQQLHQARTAAHPSPSNHQGHPQHDHQPLPLMDLSQPSPLHLRTKPQQPLPVVTLDSPTTVEIKLQQAPVSQGDGDRAAEVESAQTSAVMELLQAIAHEVRTPLTTISTLTRLLLKRTDLPPEVVKRLEAIQRECIEQIDRFSLIFRAVELETSLQQRSPSHFSSISLGQIFQDNVSRWQKQAARRNLTLDLSLPQQLPAVLSDPTMLDQVLTGVIEYLSQSLPCGSHIQLEVALAGDQLKLQLRSHTDPAPDPPTGPPPIATPTLKSVGHLLMVQPETGNLSLSLPVTKNLFQALGGKLTVRKCPQQGEVLTIFLPLG